MARFARPAVSRWAYVPVLAVTAVIVMLFSISLYFALTSPSSHRGLLYYGWWFGAPSFPWFLLIPLFFLVLFVLRWFFCWPWRRGGYGYGYYSDPAVDTLRQRFARGEITKEQLDRMRRELE